MTERVRIILVNSALMAAVSMLVFLAGTWWRLHEQFVLGEEAFRRGDFSGAVAGYESALHMYIPFHPTVEQAARQLWRIGELTEGQGEITRALVAYRALRSAFYADRWLLTPGREWIERCDKKIAALVPLQRER